MLYDYLSEFAVVGRCPSLRQAASELGISQPALGRHLSALEVKLGVKLINRDATGIVLTPDGRYALQAALDMVSIGDSLERHFKRHFEHPMGRTIVVGGVTDSREAMELLERICASVDGTREALELRHLFPRSFRSVRGALDKKDADIVVAYKAAVQAQRDQDCAALFGIDLPVTAGLAIVEADGLFAARESVRLDELATVTFARIAGTIFNADDEWLAITTACAEAGFSPVSRTLSYDTAIGLGNWNLPGCVAVVNSAYIGEQERASLAERRKRLLPIEGLAFETVALARATDGVAVALLKRAQSLLSGGLGAHPH